VQACGEACLLAGVAGANALGAETLKLGDAQALDSCEAGVALALLFPVLFAEFARLFVALVRPEATTTPTLKPTMARGKTGERILE
jgi:hypothetical protein